MSVVESIQEDKEKNEVVSHAQEDSTKGEVEYLNLIGLILSTGETRADRTGVGTIALFGCSLNFDLRLGFPLLTTKKVFWKGILTELLWVMSGSTDSKKLSAQGNHIWDKNGSIEFLHNLGFKHRREGDLGPVYGFQLRHWGTKYVDCDTDYTNRGIDQLARAIELIKNNPTDRRIIINMWNVGDLHLMALPPCHMGCQFYVSNSRTLSCIMTQRSCDMGLGVPFNIAFYALFTHLIAKVTNCTVGTLRINMGDTHVYSNHVLALREQIARSPRALPTLVIEKQTENIHDFVASDIRLDGYDPHPAIKMEMAV